MLRPVLILTALLSGCDDLVGEAAPPPPMDPIEEQIRGFSWVVDGALAGMARPGSGAPLQEDLELLALEGLDLLVSLTIDPLDPRIVESHNLIPAHIPILDMTPPSQDQIDLFVDWMVDRTQNNEQVGVHCEYGLGRTGTMLAAWFVWEGRDGTDAIGHVRMLRPGSIETQAQEQAIIDYAARLGR